MAHRAKTVPGRRSIDDRPASAADRLLLRWFPKSTDFSRVTPAEVAIAEEGVNSIHRRSLGGLTANQAFARAA